MEINTIGVAFAVIALIFAGIEQIRAEGRSLLAWAVILLALIPLLGAVVSLR